MQNTPQRASAAYFGIEKGLPQNETALFLFFQDSSKNWVEIT
jgi:hypothetical protein